MLAKSSVRYQLTSPAGRAMPAWLATTLLVVARVSALVFILPKLPRTAVPWRARVLLVMLLTAPILCVVPTYGDGWIRVAMLPAILSHEIALGISLGLVPAALLWGIQVAVQASHGMTGLPEGTAGEGEEATEPAIRRLFSMIVVTTFFLSAGHRVVFQSLLDSFSWLPPGSYTSLESKREMIIELLSMSFSLGVRAMAPITVSLLVGLVSLAMINRLVPQLGYFAVGMSFQTMLLMASLVLFVGSIVWMCEHSFQTAGGLVHNNWQDIIQASGHQ